MTAPAGSRSGNGTPAGSWGRGSRGRQERLSERCSLLTSEEAGKPRQGNSSSRSLPTKAVCTGRYSKRLRGQLNLSCGEGSRKRQAGPSPKYLLPTPVTAPEIPPLESRHVDKYLTRSASKGNLGIIRSNTLILQEGKMRPRNQASASQRRALAAS
ncbi:unnamed protein product [Rangifer tarandus platyrhynchus]|uniref:Uncharacterized protein n=2 Tax=Rangifer tarandus platyrhynchus TaxID=3082113 RepID=A0ABN8YKH4_RANTA|nr:unnamed protein product [Rangifer tarandus platyrhynchus]